MQASICEQASVSGIVVTPLLYWSADGYGRFDDLEGSIDKQKAKVYFEKIAGESSSPPKVSMRAVALLRRFILEEDFTPPDAGFTAKTSMGF